MRTLKLLQPIFLVILSLTIGILNAEDIKYDDGKDISLTKTSNKNIENTKVKLEKKDIKEKNKEQVDIKSGWKIPQSKDKYQRSTIQTH